MTPEKKYTERDLILAKREEGARARCAALCTDQLFIGNHQGYFGKPCSECRQKAAERHPLPQVTRPRVGTDSRGYDWRVFENVLQWRRCSSGWRDLQVGVLDVNVERILLLAPLLAEPNETVDDDA